MELIRNENDKYSEYEILSIAEHAAKQDAASMYRAKA